MAVKGRKNKSWNVLKNKEKGSGETGSSLFGDGIDRLVTQFMDFRWEYWCRREVMGEARGVEERLFELLGMEEHEIASIGPIRVNSHGDVASLLLGLIDDRRRGEFCSRPSEDKALKPRDAVDAESAKRIIGRLRKWIDSRYSDTAIHTEGSVPHSLNQKIDNVEAYFELAGYQEAIIRIFKRFAQSGKIMMESEVVDELRGQLKGCPENMLGYIAGFINDYNTQQAILNGDEWRLEHPIAHFAIDLRLYNVEVVGGYSDVQPSLGNVLGKLESGEIGSEKAISILHTLWNSRKEEEQRGVLEGANKILVNLINGRIKQDSATRGILKLLCIKGGDVEETVAGIVNGTMEGRMEYPEAAGRLRIILNNNGTAGRKFLESAASSILSRLGGHRLTAQARSGMIALLEEIAGGLNDVRLLKQAQKLGADIPDFRISGREQFSLKAAGAEKPVCGKRERNLRVLVDTHSGRQMWVSHRKKGRDPRQTQWEKRNPGRIKRNA